MIINALRRLTLAVAVACAAVLCAAAPAHAVDIYNADHFDPWPFADQGDLNRDLVINDGLRPKI